MVVKATNILLNRRQITRQPTLPLANGIHINYYYFITSCRETEMFSKVILIIPEIRPTSLTARMSLSNYIIVVFAARMNFGHCCA